MNTSSNSEQTVRKEVEQLMAYADSEELLAFMSEYAVRHADFREALKQQFKPIPSTDERKNNYCEEIEQCFREFSPQNARYYRYDYASDTFLDEISRKLTIYWHKAESLLDQKAYEDVASIALQVLRSVGKYYMDDHYWEYYDDYFVLEPDWQEAHKYLIMLGKMQAVPQSLKEVIMESLEQITNLRGYKEYYIFNVGKLRDDFKIYI